MNRMTQTNACNVCRDASGRRNWARRSLRQRRFAWVATGVIEDYVGSGDDIIKTWDDG